MATQTSIARRSDPVIQFSVFTPNRLGRLHDLIGLLGTEGVHVLALMVLDTTDSAIIRVVVEVTSTQLNKLMAALLEAELNINYLYSFIPHPEGKTIVGLSIEDNELAEQALRRHQFKTLRQNDISR